MELQMLCITHLEMLKEGKKRGLEPSMTSYLIAAKILKDFDVPSKLVLRDFDTTLEKISNLTSSMWDYFIGMYSITSELQNQLQSKLRMLDEFGGEIVDLTIQEFLSIEIIPLRKSISFDEFNTLLNERLSEQGYQPVHLISERKNT